MRIHLINPSDLSFGTAVITPRWLYVLAAATPREYGAPVITDETLEPFDAATLNAGDVVGIGIHTGNALRGYAVGRAAHERGATVDLSAAFTRRCSRTRPGSTAPRTPSSRVTATWCGRPCSATPRRGDAAADL